MKKLSPWLDIILINILSTRSSSLPPSGSSSGREIHFWMPFVEITSCETCLVIKIPCEKKHFSLDANLLLIRFSTWLNQAKTQVSLDLEKAAKLPRSMQFSGRQK